MSRKFGARGFESHTLLKMKEPRINTLEYNLGYYIGEYIFYRYLPTISIDMIHSGKVIKVSDEETDYFIALEDIWWKEHDLDNGKSWNDLQSYRRKMESKYLPKEFTARLNALNLTDEKEFRTGLVNSLWNCDICHYSLKQEDITIEYLPECTNITFKLNK